MDDGASPNMGTFMKRIEAIKKTILRLSSRDDDVTEAEIISMVNEGHEQGVIQESEAEMIHNIFELDDKEAKDVMIHRKNVLFVNGTMSLSEVMHFVSKSPYSRYPVFIESKDNIIGTLHIKDVLTYSLNSNLQRVPVKDIKGLIRKAVFIPETRNINSLFKEMQLKKNHMVIVMDEYGQTSGLVSLEDILEEIVGNILDEHDKEDIFIEKQKDNSYLMKGMAPLEDVSKTLGISLDTENYDTLNGYLISLLGKIPKNNESYILDDQGYTFKVLCVKHNMISSVLVSPASSMELAKEKPLYLASNVKE